ncbi:MAG: DUF2752 domain-containing protein, partial [Actinomycetota bacterium]|nr:DUF2752 domain-containing protein [Actinomycetota bacterium]
APAGVAAAAGAVLVVGALDPNEPGHYPTCPFLALTGLQCPGCGWLRALHALTRGNPVAAVDLNVLTVSALPLLAWLWLRWSRRRLRGTVVTTAAHPAWLWALLVLVAVFWVVRNTAFGAVLAP